MRDAIDPLNDFYSSNPELVRLRDPSVRYQTGTGEALPFEDSRFSLVILDNVLDHVQEASGVLRDIHRVIAQDGIFYFAVNIHTT